MKKLAFLIVLLPSSLLATGKFAKCKELKQHITKQQVRTENGAPLYTLAVLEYLISNQKERK